MQSIVRRQQMERNKKIRMFLSKTCMFIVCVAIGSATYHSYTMPKERKPMHSIFFIDTSTDGLTARQACSLEAAARANPNAIINLLFFGTKYNYNRDVWSVQLLSKYQNIKYWKSHISKYFSPNPKTVCPQYLMSESSSLLSFLMLHKFSGIFLDINLIVVKPLDTLPGNWVATKNFSALLGDAMSFSEDDVGRRIANASMELLKNITLYTKYWRNTHDVLLMDTLKLACDISDISNLTTNTCKGLAVLKPNLFNPIPSSSDYLREGVINNGTNGPYAYRFVSAREAIPVNSLLDEIAKQYCPTVYENNINEANVNLVAR